MKHQKHSKLAKPALGQWARAEWTILGTTCGNIQSLAKEVCAHLSPRWKVGYVDADHKEANEGEQNLPFSLGWTNKIGFHRLDFLQTPNLWEQRALMNELDMVLANGNHFEAARQILALDRRKFDSLTGKLERLTQVDLLLTKSGDAHFVMPAEMPEFLKNHLPDWASIPVLDTAAANRIAFFLEKNIGVPAIRALVLAGGKSTRMGQDKFAIAYHEQPHWQFLKNLLSKNGLEVYISCRVEQAEYFAGEKVITDSFADLGPMGAILSAFRHDPNAAWLVLACDLPLFDEATLQFLLSNRNSSAVATAFRQPSDEAGFPEPLVALWEPKSYARLLQFLAQGVSCPRKVLINSFIHLLDAPSPESLTNANTPEERDAILGR